MEEIRRVAAHEVIVGEEKFIQAVVEIEEGRVVNYYEFSGELPLTEWLGGKIEIKRDDEGILRAYQNNKVLC